MNKIAIVLVLILSLVFAYHASAASVLPDTLIENASNWSGGFEVAGTNNYVWRGMPINEGVIAQPYAWFSWKNWTFSLWGSITLSEKNDWDKWYEIDPVISYAFELMSFTIEPSFNYYYYIDQVDCPNTGELGLSLGYPVFDIITLNARAYLDVVEYPGAVYAEQSIDVEKEFNDHWSFFTALTLGSGLKKFNESYFSEEGHDVAKSTLSLLTLDCRLTYSASNGLYVQPYFQLNKTLNSVLEPYINKQSSIFGLIVGKEF
jgi:hypothetical protein